MLDILQRVLPFFLLAGAGFVLGWLRPYDETMSAGLSGYVYWIGFPALLIHGIGTAPRPDAATVTGYAAYAAAMFAIMGVTLAVGFLLRWSKADRAGAAMAASINNSAFLGLPVAAAVLGPAVGAGAAATVAIDFVLISAVAVSLLGAAGGASPARAMLAALRNPIVLAALVGTGLCLSGIKLPGLIDNTVSAAAATGSPVGLVALGVTLGLKRAGPREPLHVSVFIVTLLKLVLAPAVVWFAVGLTHAPENFRAAATLIAASPTAVAVFIQTRHYGVYALNGARAVAITTAASVVTLTALAILLTR